MVANPQQDPQRIYMSVEEYLAYDRASEIKHEYYDGEVVAMAGGKIAHNSLAGAMYFQLREQLGHRSPCRVYNSDTRVQITKKQYVYPDVVVSCDISDHQDNSDILYSPRLIVEVLSPSTEAKDRGIKLNWYRAHPCVYEYILINTRFQLVEIHRRNENSSWAYLTYGPGETIELTSLDLRISVDALYEGLRIPIGQTDEQYIPDVQLDEQ